MVMCGVLFVVKTEFLDIILTMFGFTELRNVSKKLQQKQSHNTPMDVHGGKKV
jgi:hypothetical protein